MKIGLIADIHYGPDRDTQLGTRAPQMLETFREAMVVFRPDVIIDLGDRLNRVTPEEDRQRTSWVRRTLTAIGVPVYHVPGNTDVANLPKPELAVLLEKSGPYECIDLSALRVLLLDSLDPPVRGVGGAIGEEQVAWLESVLARPGPVMVCCHHPLDEQDLRGHRYFASDPDLAHVRNRGHIRTLLERAGHVLAVFAGHMHWTCARVINRIPYVTLGSLVDAGYTDGEPCGAFAAVSIGEGIHVEVAGCRPAAFHFPC
jgi:3',5'-cyclic AMP phosphodiesterase CpdA